MSGLDLINFLMINDVSHSTQNNEHLQDLRERSDFIAQKTGVKPTSWYEFKESQPPEEAHTLRNIGIGAGIGFGAGALLAMMFVPFTAATASIIALGGLSFAITGAAIGAFANTENTRRDKMVKKYETYLNNFEMSLGRGRAYTIDKMPELREGENVERLRQGAPVLANQR